MYKIHGCLGWFLFTVALSGCGAEPTQVHAPKQPVFKIAAAQDQSIAPFTTSQDDVASHELFRNVQFEELTKTMPDGTVDHIDFDGTLSTFVLARVSAKLPSMGSRFETTFRNDDGTTLVKQWASAQGASNETATGLFIIPSSITSASTRVIAESSEN